MKRALLIICAVGAYCVAEVVLLFNVPILMFEEYKPGPLRYLFLASAFAHLITIPGLAAFLSRINYGPEKWPIRALLHLLLGVLLTPALICLILVVVAPLAWAFSISKPLFAVLLPVLLGGAGVAIAWIIRKGVRRGIQLESTHWSAERERGKSAAERKWRGRGLRVAVCVPVFVVLFVFIFLPQTWGFLSHVARPRAGHLVGYRVSIPPTWMIQLVRKFENGESSATGLAGRGWAFGGEPYVHAELPIGSWSVWTEPFHQTEPSPYADFVDRDGEIISTREFRIGDEQLTCDEYVPGWLKRAHFAADVNRVFVGCKSDGRLRASMAGKRTFVPEFYKMVGGIQKMR